MTFYIYLTILLLAVFVLLVVFLIIQFYLMRKLYNSINVFNNAIKKLTGESQETNSVLGNTSENVTVVQSPASPSSTPPSQEQSSSTLQPSNGLSKRQEIGAAILEKCKDSKKQEVLKSIKKRREVKEEHLPTVMNELLSFFSQYPVGDWTEKINDHSYYRLLDLRKDSSARVVVIGDIHCDYYSLAAILLKLSIAQYDYFEKAYFIFLGDYLDRGSNLFEPLLLLKDLKEILGDRLIMLRGNHESVSYDGDNNKLKSRVRPNESCGCLNEYCGGSSKFLKAFSHFFSKLPTYVYLKTPNKNVLLTHASIPRDIFLSSFVFDNEGRMRFENIIPESERLSQRKIILKDMIWGDPKDYDEKIQIEGRFEFGRKQFERFSSHHNINLILRSHEEAPFGYKSFFGDRLYTIFSTGGDKNPQTGYPEAEPAFAVIQGDNLKIENSFLYQYLEGGNRWAINLFSGQKYHGKETGGFQLAEEFVCDAKHRECLRNTFKEIKKLFPSDFGEATS